MKKLFALVVILLLLICYNSKSQIHPGALHRLIGNPSAGGSADSPTNWASLVTWYEPGGVYDLTLTNKAIENTAVGRWEDKSGNNHDLYVIYEGGNYATNRFGGANGSNYVAFRMDAVATEPSAYSNNLYFSGNYTIVGLIQILTIPFSVDRMVFNTASNAYLIVSHQSPDKTATIGAILGPPTLSTNTWANYTITGNYNGSTGITNMICYVNTAYYTNSTSLVTKPFSGFGIGVKSGSKGSGYYQEILIYNAVLTTNQITSVYNYLKDKYGL